MDDLSTFLTEIANACNFARINRGSCNFPSSQIIEKKLYNRHQSTVWSRREDGTSPGRALAGEYCTMIPPHKHQLQAPKNLKKFKNQLVPHCRYSKIESAHAWRKCMVLLQKSLPALPIRSHWEAGSPDDGAARYHRGVGQRFFLSDISLLSDGLGQCSGVPPNLSQHSDTIWQLLFQKENVAAQPLDS
jgi:hypothetical protein